MAWTAPKTFSDGVTLTAAELNEQIRDNLMMCAPAKALRQKGYFVAVDPNEIEMRLPKKHTVLTTEETTSTSYVDLTTIGPRIETSTNTEALAIWGCQFYSTTSGNSKFMSLAVSGNTTEAASTDNALRIMTELNQKQQASQFKFYTELVPGTNIFTCKYAVGAGTGTFTRRRLCLLPF